jgi:chaperonin GroES
MNETLQTYMTSDNVANYLNEEELADIADKVITEYKLDESSREEWLNKSRKALDLAMLIGGSKSFPFEDAANVKYPMIATAAIQFAARAYPNIVKGKDVVKGKVVGYATPDKRDKAARVGTHMSYQCLEEMEEWEDQLDCALTALPIVGCAFKKTYWDGSRKRNMSEYRSAENVVINYFAKSLDTAPRITDKIELYPNEIKELQLAGIFTDEDFGESTTTIREDQEKQDDPDKSHVFLEQHRWLDLDNDGLKEPYVVTVHMDSEKVARIKARFRGDGVVEKKGRIVRFKPEQHFTMYPFMKSPDGGIYGMGFGALLFPMNETVNTTINQLLDSGTLANSQTGFIGGGLSLGRGRGGGNMTFTMGEWKHVRHTGDDLRKNIFPLPVREPSAVLFNLLGFMVEAGEKVSSVSEIMTGDQSVHNEPATTTLARIEQGQKVFSAIYKRVYRGMKAEFKKLYRLNYLYLNPETYYTVLDADKPSKVLATDYDPKSIDVVPVSDPTEVSDTQKLLKSEILMSMMGRGLNDEEIIKRRLAALNIEDIENLIPSTGYQSPPDPKIELEKQKMELEKAKLALEAEKWQMEKVEIQSKVVKNLADAESKELGPQLEKYKADMQGMIAREKANADKEKRVQGMANSSGNGGSSQSNAGTQG